LWKEILSTQNVPVLASSCGPATLNLAAYRSAAGAAEVIIRRNVPKVPI
jgi:hypothetical protein